MAAAKVLTPFLNKLRSAADLAQAAARVADMDLDAARIHMPDGLGARKSEALIYSAVVCIGYGGDLGVKGVHGSVAPGRRSRMIRCAGCDSSTLQNTATG